MDRYILSISNATSPLSIEPTTRNGAVFSPISMLDYERLLSPNRIKEGYTFDQTETHILVTFPVPEDKVRLAGVEFHFEDVEIYAGCPNSAPAVCGTLFDRITHHSMQIEDEVCTIKLTKAAPVTWPLLITDESKAGIDPKSLFMLGIRDEFVGCPDQAWDCYTAAAARGYVTAKLLVARTLLTGSETYKVPKEERLAIEILMSIPEEQQTVEVLNLLSDALIQVGEVEEGRRVLLRAAEKSPASRLRLTKLLNSIPDPAGANVRERVQHLEVLARADNPEAIQLLSQCYATGKGVKKNVRHALELAKRAKMLDPSLPDPFKINGVSAGMMVTAAISTVVLGVTLWVWKRKH